MANKSRHLLYKTMQSSSICLGRLVMFLRSHFKATFDRNQSLKIARGRMGMRGGFWRRQYKPAITHLRWLDLNSMLPISDQICDIFLANFSPELLISSLLVLRASWMCSENSLGSYSCSCSKQLQNLLLQAGDCFGYQQSLLVTLIELVDVLCLLCVRWQSECCLFCLVTWQNFDY